MAACSFLTWVSRCIRCPAERPPLSKVEKDPGIRPIAQAEQINLLEKAVNISSGTLNLAGVRAVGKLLEPELLHRLARPRDRFPDAVGRRASLSPKQGTEERGFSRTPRHGVRGRRGEFVRYDTLAAGRVAAT